MLKQLWPLTLFKQQPKKYYSFGLEHITIFDRRGVSIGGLWFIGEASSQSARGVKPCPATDEVSKLISLYEDDEIAAIVLSDRVAIQLWLSHKLRNRDFRNSHGHEVNGVQCIILQAAFGFPMAIVPEHITKSILLLDSNNTVVGTEGQQYSLPIVQLLSQEQK